MKSDNVDIFLSGTGRLRIARQQPPRLSSIKRTIIAMLVSLLTSLAYSAERNVRFAKKFQIPGSAGVVVVAEGDFEPRSIGSYAFRVYERTSKKFSTDQFVMGLLRPRNGTVEAVKFVDVDGDDRPEIVVIIRSIGSGGYLSADAFRYRTGSLEFIGSVLDLDKGADPVQTMRDKFKVPNGRKSTAK